MERVRGPAQAAPFPVHEALLERLLGAHASPGGPRDDVVAHALACCAGYAYGDLDTVATVASRIGLPGCGAVRVSQVVDAMLVFSTAYLVQSACGRVVILAYRGTEPSNLGSWLADMDVGSESMTIGGVAVRVPAGFRRNVRATRWAVLHELTAALEGRSLLDHETRVAHPMEAFYVTGHSLGAAMGILFTLSLAGVPEHRALTERLRAVYSYGQPLTVGLPLPPLAAELGQRVYRHVMTGDPIAALPPGAWCRLAHFGREWRFADGVWAESASTRQLAAWRELPKTLLAAAAGSRSGAALSRLRTHSPHLYIGALQPEGRVTELGDVP